MANYSTKIMRPANLRGLSAAREAIDRIIEQAEQEGVTGDLVLTLHVKDGSVTGMRQASTKLIPITERNV